MRHIIVAANGKQFLQDDMELQNIIATRPKKLVPSEKAKWFNIVAELPSLDARRELIDIFFTEANWYFAVLERYYFEKFYDYWCALGDDVSKSDEIEELSSDLLHFPALLFQVLAVALRFTEPDTLSSGALGMRDYVSCNHLSCCYSENGMKIMSLLGRDDASITAVQHDLMRALWLKNLSQGKRAWHILGGAIRSVRSRRFACPQ